MERNDLIKINGPIFTGQGRAINDGASKDVRVASSAIPATRTA
jgi:malate dehydrogenase